MCANHKNSVRLGRRTFLKGALGTGAVVGGLTAPVSASGQDNDNRGLKPVPIDFRLYWSAAEIAASDDDPDDPTDYGYQDQAGDDTVSAPGLNGSTHGRYFQFHDPFGDTFFDVDEIEMTPNGGTLHNSLQFFQGLLLAEDSKSKPYVLTHEGNGLYVSRGQVMNFETKNQQDLVAALKQFAQALGFTLKQLRQVIDVEPLFRLANGRWRAAADEFVQVQTVEGDPAPAWGATRVDFYSRTESGPRFHQSLLYTIWATPARQPAPATGPIPAVVDSRSRELITAGRLNEGGQ